jgi:putative addiction module killer protein
MDYTSAMVEVHQSDTFKTWLAKLKDRQAVARINARILRLSATGNFGDVKPVLQGVSAMRIDHGPGYRLYFMQRGAILVVWPVATRAHRGQTSSAQSKSQRSGGIEHG